MLNYKIIAIVVFSFLLASCTSTNTKPVSVNFNTDSSKIVISNINAVALLQIKSNINSYASYQNLVTVLQIPPQNDTISLEKECPGKLSLNNTALIFTPNTPFVKGNTYLISTLINVQFLTTEKILKSKIEPKLGAQQQILVR